MHNRDSSKNGNHNLGGSMRPMSTRFHMSDGGMVSVPIPKLDPAKAARDSAREAKKPAVDDTPLGRSFFDVVKDRGKDLMDAEDRMVKGTKPVEKRDGGRIRLADGGDPFKSNDDGGGGAFAAREAYEARQAPPEVRDADAMNSDPSRAAPEAAGPPAPEAAPASEAAPSAMPKEITTLTPAEKAGAMAGATAAKTDTQKRMERGAANAVNIASTMNPSVGAGYEAGKAARKVADGEDQVSRATKGSEEPKSKSEASHPIVEGLKKLGGMFAVKAQRNRGYEQDAPAKSATADESSTKTSTSTKSSGGLTDDQKKRIDAMQRKT